MLRSLRRFAVLLALAVPILVVGLARATWGAPPASKVHARQAHGFESPPLPTAIAVAPERSEAAVVLVVLDGVRWQEVFTGADRDLARSCGFSAGAWTSARALMPNLHRWMEDGPAAASPGRGQTSTRGLAIGAPSRSRGSGGISGISASGPNFISLPGYMEIFSGHPDPACDTNDCPRPLEPTIADDVQASGGADDVAVVTSWPAIARAASSVEPTFLVSAGRKLLEHGGVLDADTEAGTLLERTAHGGALPGEGDYRQDALTAGLALRVLSDLRPRFLFVGLGDADEHAHRGNYLGYLEALRAADAFLGELGDMLRSMGARGEHTTILVTTDHGRAYDFADHGARFPESSRAWLVAAGEDVRGRGPVAGSRQYTLSNIAPTVRALLGMGRGDGEAISEIVGE